MALRKFTGTGRITDADYKLVKWVGKTKAGKAIQITIKEAINLGSTEWAFADKDDTVAEAVFTACYTQADLDAGKTDEPWEVEYDDTVVKAEEEIVLGAGKFYIGDTPIALTRGGGKFSREPEYREIEADGDRGPVKGRITIDGVRATLTMNTLQILTRLADLYTGLQEVVEQPAG
ncbi:hypothetical protein I5677_12100 [Mobilitalea sibirica]|uniref:Uncharacterized protein n=1 Tax=Mobilitalea sibirica TaxID=1462919 RepID=A0A8J7KWQ6_9FIRM|nr:hypothetical protein [Mobilitalea sibirica]MBH1941635.1 hypothetical protein [Mobilitalea sibirica]